MAKDKAAEALDHYRRGLAAAKTAVTRDAGNLEGSATLPRVITRSARSSWRASNSAEARDLLEQGRAIIARLERVASDQAQWRSDLSRFDEALRTLGYVRLAARGPRHSGKAHSDDRGLAAARDCKRVAAWVARFSSAIAAMIARATPGVSTTAWRRLSVKTTCSLTSSELNEAQTFALRCRSPSGMRRLCHADRLRLARRTRHPRRRPPRRHGRLREARNCRSIGARYPAISVFS